MSTPGDRPLPDPRTVFLNLAQIVYDQASYEDVYSAICTTAVQVIPGCDHACITSLRGGGELVTEGATDDVATLIDKYERQTGQGPCLDAILDVAYQHDPDITVRSAWPELTELVLENTPVRGMIGYRLLVGERKAGALNIFSDTADALTKNSADMGAIVAAFASVTIAGAAANDRADTLHQGLKSNREIGKAIGLLMATHHVDEDAAFDVLRRTSSQMNIKLAEVARRFVEEHRGAE